MQAIPFIEPVRDIVRMKTLLQKEGMKYFNITTVIGYLTEYIKLLTNHRYGKQGNSAQDVNLDFNKRNILQWACSLSTFYLKSLYLK